MNKIKKYQEISDDLKYLSNSMIRILILNSLAKKPQNMKELTYDTNQAYSSISGVIHELELKNMVYKKSNKYYLTNSIKVVMDEIVELKNIINLLDGIRDFTNGHKIEKIPEESVYELHLLENIEFFDTELDSDNLFLFIENALTDANCAKCVLPGVHDEFIDKLNELVDDGAFIEIDVFKDSYNEYANKTHVNDILSFNESENFLLIITDKIMIFGLFNDDGIFDQNKFIASSSENSLKWADNLLKRFRRINK